MGSGSSRHYSPYCSQRKSRCVSVEIETSICYDYKSCYEHGVNKTFIDNEDRSLFTDVGTNFSKEYSHYWSGTSKNSSDYSMERNAYSTQSGAYSSPPDSRRYSQFVSSFGKS